MGPWAHKSGRRDEGTETTTTATRKGGTSAAAATRSARFVVFPVRPLGGAIVRATCRCTQLLLLLLDGGGGGGGAAPAHERYATRRLPKCRPSKILSARPGVSPPPPPPPCVPASNSHARALSSPAQSTSQPASRPALCPPVPETAPRRLLALPPPYLRWPAVPGRHPKTASLRPSSRRLPPRRWRDTGPALGRRVRASGQGAKDAARPDHAGGSAHCRAINARHRRRRVTTTVGRAACCHCSAWQRRPPTTLPFFIFILYPMYYRAGLFPLYFYSTTRVFCAYQCFRPETRVHTIIFVYLILYTPNPVVLDLEVAKNNEPTKWFFIK